MFSHLSIQIDSLEKNNSNSDYSDEELINSRIEEFQQTLEKLKLFLQELSREKEEIYEKEIIEYSGKSSILNLSDEDILKLCAKRIEKMMRNKKTKKNWNEHDVDILVWVLNKYIATFAKKSVHLLDDEDWKFISSLIPATSPKRCMFKWLSLKKFSLMAFRWSKEESILLETFVKENAKKDWKKIAEELYLKNSSEDKVFRTPKQCREHWNCYVNPSIKKGPWAVEEDIKLLESVLELNCLKKWSEVAKGIKGRTENAVKNRFSLLIEKEKRETGESNEKHLINRILFRLFQENSGSHLRMRSEELDELQMPQQIFEESKNSISVEQKVNLEPANNNKSSGNIGNTSTNPEEPIKINNVIVPTVIQNPTVYNMESYIPICSSFNPYFFNFLYGAHYQMN